MLGRDGSELEIDVPMERIPSSLRLPNSRFVAVVVGCDFLRVEFAGKEWMEIQDQIRTVLNVAWDPLRVADAVDGEYDNYIAGIHSLLQAVTSAEMLVAHLLSIEVEWMEIRPPLTVKHVLGGLQVVTECAAGEQNELSSSVPGVV